MLYGCTGLWRACRQDVGHPRCGALFFLLLRATLHLPDDSLPAKLSSVARAVTQCTRAVQHAAQHDLEL